MKTYGSGGIAPPFLTSALGGGERSSYVPASLPSGEITHSTNCIGGWVVPRAGNRTWAVQPVARRCPDTSGNNLGNWKLHIGSHSTTPNQQRLLFDEFFIY
jgi:hypothetical protein